MSITSLLKVTDTYLDVSRQYARMAETIELLCENDFKVIDDHNSGRDVIDMSKGWGLVEYQNTICPFPTKMGGACLNPLYISHSTGPEAVHLSCSSLGGYFADTDALTKAGITFHTI